MRHGLTSKTHTPPEYTAWRRMKVRCLTPGSKDYENYGARGISVYPGWVDNFQAFFEHIGPRPSPFHSIDRIDNSKGYEPGNVRWATIVEQNNNKRTNNVIAFGGKSQTLAQWAREIGVPRITLSARIHTHGMSIEKALTLPRRRNGRAA